MSHDKIAATYDRLWQEAIKAKAFNVGTDLLNQQDDSKRAISLICRPSRAVQQAIMRFLKQAYQLEPDQYYYQPTEFHTTILSIISCASHIDTSQLSYTPYIEAIEKAVRTIPSFQINYEGITASPDGVMIQGFPDDSTLVLLRDNIRKNIKEADVLNTLDQRYKAHTAHITCLRFQQSYLKHRKDFFNFLAENRSLSFGTSKISEIELVRNNWFMQHDQTEQIATVPLLST
ncbi:hypothetical protein [Amphibacillus cookii]|uniref:hypothetical protein n=1 Tax=Amphibacillus cookii TaxID=767787 RepID=UPI00195ADC5A|nr:hypothetical protein [Amphibacillus cookii]MBM7542677.1 2'-5' RNA ligase [Amphibacillus cookii]